MYYATLFAAPGSNYISYVIFCRISHCQIYVSIHWSWYCLYDTITLFCTIL